MISDGTTMKNQQVVVTCETEVTKKKKTKKITTAIKKNVS
jgi:hypothetical protein